MSDFKQAIEWMKVDKKVHRKNWKDFYIYFDGTFIRTNDGKVVDTLFQIMLNFEATDWEIYEEPKESLSDNEVYFPKPGQVYSEGLYFPIKIIEEKIQNVHRRLREAHFFTSNHADHERFIEESNKIFEEEFGKKLFGGKDE